MAKKKRKNQKYFRILPRGDRPAKKNEYDASVICRENLFGIYAISRDEIATLTDSDMRKIAGKIIATYDDTTSWEKVEKFIRIILKQKTAVKGR